MMDAKYVLCRWKKRLWPAKVLLRTEISTKNKRKKEFFLDVQILSLEEKIRVRSTGVQSLTKSRIEDIASLLASQSETSASALEELAYRRSLRVALDILNEAAGSNPDRLSGEGRTARSLSPKPADPAVAPCGPGAAPVFPDNASGLSPPGRKGRAPHNQPSSPLCTEDLRDPGFPLAPLGRAGFRGRSRSQTLRKMPARPGQRERNGAQRLSLSHSGPSSPSKREENQRRERAGSPPSLASPFRDSTLTRGGQVSPVRPLPVLPAWQQKAGDTCQETETHWTSCPDTRELPAKRPRLDEPEPVPADCVSLHGAKCASEPHAPEPEKAEEGHQSAEGSVDLSPIDSTLEEDEEEEPPRILLYHEPRSFEVGMLVWLKYQKYPFWPAVVKSLRRRDKKASVLFIEGNMNPKGRGITVSLRRLKHFDCKEKQLLLHQAKQDFEQAVGWCVSLITDYRVRLGCGSFTGSFLEYYAADISYPVRKSIQQDVLGATFPQLRGVDPEEPAAGSPQNRSQPCRKVLPDRSRAARDRANQRLVEYIVKARGTESHLRAILKSRKPSRWLKTFLSSSQYVTCVETYLEDEEQLDLVVKYLQGVYQDMGSTALTRLSGDSIRFILDVLLPEAIICAIAAVDEVDYKTAEEKYIRGPSLGYREKEMFDHQLLEERSRRRR